MCSSIVRQFGSDKAVGSFTKTRFGGPCFDECVSADFIFNCTFLFSVDGFIVSGVDNKVR